MDDSSSSSNRQCPKGNEAVPTQKIIDGWGRIWTYRGNRILVSYNSGSSWLTLTPENSGLGGQREFEIVDVIFDDIQRLWVLDTNGVRMIPLDNLEPVPQEIINQKNQTRKIREATAGYVWFLPSILAFVWLAIYLNVLPGVLLSLLFGGIGILIFGGSLTYSSYPNINPGVIAIYSGLIGALAGGLIDRENERQSKTKTEMNLKGAGIGLFVGFVIGYTWHLFWAIVAPPLIL